MYGSLLSGTLLDNPQLPQTSQILISVPQLILNSRKLLCSAYDSFFSASRSGMLLQAIKGVVIGPTYFPSLREQPFFFFFDFCCISENHCLKILSCFLVVYCGSIILVLPSFQETESPVLEIVSWMLQIIH